MCTDRELREKIAFYKECRKQEKIYSDMKKAASLEIIAELKVRNIEKWENVRHTIRVMETVDTGKLKTLFPDIWQQVKKESISEYITAR